MSEDNSQILLSAGLDLSGFVEAIDKAVGGLNRWKQVEQDLNTQITETENRIKENNAQIDSFRAKIEAAGKQTGVSANEVKRWNDSIKILTTQNKNLTDTVQKQREQLTQTTATVGKLQKSYDDAAASAKKLDDAGSKMGSGLNPSTLFNKLSSIRDRVKTSVSEIGRELESGGNLTDSLASGALAFGAIGAAASIAIPQIIDLIKKLTDEETELERTTRLSTTAFTGMADGVAKATTEVDRVKSSFDLAAKGVISKKEALDLYNETLGKVLGVTKDLNEAEERTIRNADAYIRIQGLKAQIEAIYAARGEVLKKQVLARANVGGEDAGGFGAFVLGLNAVDDFLTGKTESVFDAYKQKQEDTRRRKNQGVVSDAQKDLNVLNQLLEDSQNQLAEALLPFKDLPKSFEKTAKTATREVANIYEKELQKLREDISQANTKVFTDRNSIKKQVEEEMKTRAQAWGEAVKRGALTQGQADALRNQLGELEDLILTKRLTDFEAKRSEYLSRIDGIIDATRRETQLKRINLIQNEFERERQLIDDEFARLVESTTQKRDKAIADAEKNAAANGITGPELAAIRQQITSEYDLLLNELSRIRAQRQQQLSFRVFQNALSELKRFAEAEKLAVNEATADQAQALNQQFVTGKISYEKYQKELTALLKKAAAERAAIERAELEKQLGAIIGKLAFDKALTPAQRRQLEDQATQIRNQIAAADTKEAQDIEDPKTREKIAQRMQSISQYASAIGQLINNVVGFWAAMNEAEQRALDRSIAIQEKRVESARRIAERGNAEYLRLEEDRLRDLEVKRENAARRQLGINAVLQGSQILTAFISGIAQATAVGGPLGAILGVATVAGAIASGIALAKSLQPQTPSFFVGTEDTTPFANKSKRVDGRGGFMAVLHPEERVVKAEHNRKMRGLSNEQLATLANAYKTGQLYTHNHVAFQSAATFGATENHRLAAIMEKSGRALEENNELHRRTHKYLRSMGVNVNIDRNGFAMSLMEVTERESKRKKI